MAPRTCNFFVAVGIKERNKIKKKKINLVGSLTATISKFQKTGCTNKKALGTDRKLFYSICKFSPR
jgi:hypothetical protein